MSSPFLDQYRRWFAYETDMHRQVLASMDTVPASERESPSYHKALELMGHILAARKMWLHRMDASFERPTEIFPKDVDRSNLADGFAAMERDWTSHFERLTDADLSHAFTYRMMDGTSYRSVLADVLTQLHGHSLYHRGQIATLVRACGGEPAATDFIYWSRELVEA